MLLGAAVTSLPDHSTVGRPVGLPPQPSQDSCSDSRPCSHAGTTWHFQRHAAPRTQSVAPERPLGYLPTMYLLHTMLNIYLIIVLLCHGPWHTTLWCRAMAHNPNIHAWPVWPGIPTTQHNTQTYICIACYHHCRNHHSGGHLTTHRLQQPRNSPLQAMHYQRPAGSLRYTRPAGTCGPTTITVDASQQRCCSMCCT
jgi:hypothetical protein